VVNGRGKMGVQAVGAASAGDPGVHAYTVAACGQQRGSLLNSATLGPEMTAQTVKPVRRPLRFRRSLDSI
jgi:hypothetical protein